MAYSSNCPGSSIGKNPNDGLDECRVLTLTVEENRAIYWSRSRQKLWRKGEESGHVQHIKEIRLDCDSDVIILTVDQVGGIAVIPEENLAFIMC